MQARFRGERLKFGGACEKAEIVVIFGVKCALWYSRKECL